MPEARLTIGGRKYDRWRSVQITRSVEVFAPTWSVSYVDEWAEAGLPIPFAEFDDVSIEMVDDLGVPTQVMTGFINVIDQSEDGGDSPASLSISGVAATGHLVAGAAQHASGHWKDRDALGIINEVLEPYSLLMRAETPDITAALLADPFRRFAIEDGETAFDLINRIASMRALIPQTDTFGNPLFTKAGIGGPAPSQIVRGQNITRSSFRTDFRDRHSAYICKGQSAGDETWFGEDAKGAFFESVDDQVKVHRPMIFQAEGHGTKPECEKRADWQRNVNAGRSRRFKYSVPGWHHTAGLWLQNTLITVVDPRYQVVGEQMLAVACTYRQQKGSPTETQIELGAPETYDPIKPPPDVLRRAARRAW